MKRKKIGLTLGRKEMRLLFMNKMSILMEIERNEEMMASSLINQQRKRKYNFP
jgi:hypothetical protein